MSSATIPQLTVPVTPSLSSVLPSTTGVGHGAAVGLHVSAAASHAVVTATMAVGAAVAAGAVAVLVARAAASGAARGADLVIRLDERLVRQEQAAFTAEQEAIVWQAIATEVVETNARIAAVRARATRLGADPDAPPLPPPISMLGRTPCEADELCRLGAEAVATLERWLDDRTRAAFRRRLGAILPIPAQDGDREDLAHQAVAAAEAAAQADAALAETTAPATPVTGQRPTPLRPPGRHSEILRPRIERRTATLSHLASPEEAAAVVAAAAAVLAAADAAVRGGGHPLGAAGPKLDQLGRVISEINARAGRRQDDALRAARYLQALEQATEHPLADLPDGPMTAAADQLRQVVAGERELDDALVSTAECERARVGAAGLRLLERDLVRAALTRLGYTVEGDFDTLASDFDRLRIHRPGWDPDHHAEVVVERGGIRASLVRDSGAAGVDDLRLDEERCQRLLADLERLGADLAGDEPGRAGRRHTTEVSTRVQHTDDAVAAGETSADESRPAADTRPRARELPS